MPRLSGVRSASAAPLGLPAATAPPHDQPLLLVEPQQALVVQNVAFPAQQDAQSPVGRALVAHLRDYTTPWLSAEGIVAVARVTASIFATSPSRLHYPLLVDSLSINSSCCSFIGRARMSLGSATSS